MAAVCGGIGLAVTLARLSPAQQLRASIDAGSSNVKYADSITSTAFALSPALELQSRRAAVGLNGTMTQASGASTLSGTLVGSFTAFTRGKLSGEIGASAGGSSHSDGSTTSQRLGTARLYVMAARGGGWVGGGAGTTDDGARSFGVLQGNVGGWLTGAAGVAMLSILPTAVDDTIRYSDLGLSVQRSAGRLELGANVGVRAGDPLPSLVTDRVWGSVTLTSWLRPNLGIVAGAGTYPIDFTQGFPGGRFVTVSVRMAATRRATSNGEAAQAAAAATNVAQAFDVQGVSGNDRRFRVRAPFATSVAIAGDFTSWRAVPLADEGGGWWSVTLPVTAGTHEVELIVNGIRVVPPGLTSVRDEFGGASGLLVIPGR